MGKRVSGQFLLITNRQQISLQRLGESPIESLAWFMLML